MRRREFILGLAMLANVGSASAQGRARRVGALIAEPAQANFLETFLREKGWIITNARARFGNRKRAPPRGELGAI